ncbi:MAG: hypothetical protein PHI98_16460, partial [Eubacteriales bacterium]|nr:hypothetical protein [Eubacteriales bacterium]
MPMMRLLVILSDLPDEQAAANTAHRALLTAGSPNGLRFALPKRMELRFRALWKDQDRFVFYGERSGLKAVAALLTDENFFLSLMGEYGFEPKWDQTLLSRFLKINDQHCLLTGTIGELDGEFPPQPYLPALGESFEKEGVLIQRGLPLVCSAGPVPTLVIDPALIFGRVDFLRTVELRRETLSFAAYAAGVTVYALDRAALWPLHKPADRRLRRPAPELLPGTTLARFEQLAGFHYEQKRAGVRTNWGLFTIDDGYPQQLPAKLMVKDRVKSVLHRQKAGSTPLLVTAFIDLPAPTK